MKTLPKTLNISILISVGCLFTLTFPAEPTQNIQKEIQKQNLRITKLLRPAAKQKVDRSKKSFQHRMFSQEGDVDCYREAFQTVQREFRNPSTTESEVIMYTIMYETLQALEEDMKELAEEINKMNRAKSKLRKQIQEIRKQISESRSKPQKTQELKTLKRPAETRPSASRLKSQPKLKESTHLGIKFPQTPKVPELPDTGKVTIQGLKTLLDDLKGKLDGMNEMSEMTSLRLQMTMDRRSKFISTLSQMMKKISTTQDILVQNIK